jgi:predicted metal-dependent phosphoesterase TrpH
MPELFADLHIHTNKSDSTLSPEEVIKYAAQSGLNAIAITDHDSIDAIPLVEHYAEKYHIEVIPGVELSTDTNGDEVHILGYYVDYKNEWFLEKLKFFKDARIKRAQQIIEKLNELGFLISFEDVYNLSGEGAVGRMHIARVMLAKQYVSSIGEAFNRFLAKGKRAYVKKYQISPKEAIDIIKKANGISVVAHPQIMNNDSLIPLMVKDGLDGIEVYHTDHTSEATKKYLDIAIKYNLLVTGGSDCHGVGKGKILMGTVKIPYDMVAKIKARLRK